MCFSQEMSATFSAVGLLLAIWVMRTNGNTNVVKGILYFVLMEMLQVVQYMHIATDIDPAAPTLGAMQSSPQCQSQANRVLTVLGLVHIAFQPFYSAHLSCAFVRNPKNVAQFELVKRLQLIGGTFICLRWALTYVDVSTLAALGIDSRYAFDAAQWAGVGTEIEWLSGPVLCTYKGFKHLAWSVPLLPTSYYMPSMGLHLFLMFIPFFAMDNGSFGRNIANYIAGIILFVSGPLMADTVTPNKHEAASIWCFWSITQIIILVAIIFVQHHSRGRWFTAGKKTAGKANGTANGKSIKAN